MADPILLNDFRRQWSMIAEEVLDATRHVGESGWYVLGASVTGFEADLAGFAGRHHAVGVANGLDAIEIALRSLGLKPGQKVLTTPLSAFATTLAIYRAGGVPVYVDTDAYGLLNFDLAEQALRADPDIRFCVPVHLYGHALDLKRLAILRAEHDLHVVEDMAQALGAGWGGHPVGSAGDAAAVSFYPTKNLGALGDAGALLTDDDALARTAASLRDYGQVAKYEHVALGMNSRLDEVHAAILRAAMLPRLPLWTKRRREIAKAYLAGLASPHVTPLGAPTDSDSVWHLFPVLARGVGRDSLARHLQDKGVHTAVHYPKLISDQPALSGVPHEVVSGLDVAGQIAGTELSLPIHPFLTDDDIQRVIAGVNSWSGE